MVKKIIKKVKMEVHIKEKKPEDYKPIFFNKDFKEEKQSLFFD